MSVPRFGSQPAQGQQYGGFLDSVWTAACAALAVPAEQTPRSRRELRAILPAWAGDPITAAPARPSYVGGDGFPAELSVNWSGPSPELRVLFDCLSDVRLDSRAGRDPRAARWATSDRFRRIHDGVFGGTVDAAPLWHSLAWRRPDRLQHKVYLGLFELPYEARYAAVEQAMSLVGMRAAWDATRSWVERDGSAGEGREVEFIGLDLPDHTAARVKVYYRHHRVDVEELDRVAAAAVSHDRRAGLAAYRQLTGGRDFAGEAPLTCFAFRAGLDRAAEATTYLRMPSVASCDQESTERTASLLRREQVDPRSFNALVDAFTPDRPGASRGALELVSHRTGRTSGGDVTTYFRFPVHTRAAVPVASAGRS